MLRDLETQIEAQAALLGRFETGESQRNRDLEEQAWTLLAFAYRLREYYEREFDILNGKDPVAHLELWRSHVEA